MKSFSQLMTSASGRLCHLSKHSHKLQMLDNIVKDSLPAPLNQHCYVANLREKTLVVHTDSSIWATRLRYMIPFLVLRWQRDVSMPTIEQIDVKVRPLSNPLSKNHQTTVLEYNSRAFNTID